MVDVRRVAGIRRLDVAGDLDGGGHGLGATAGDFELGAGDLVVALGFLREYPV